MNIIIDTKKVGKFGSIISDLTNNNVAFQNAGDTRLYWGGGGQNLATAEKAKEFNINPSILQNINKKILNNAIENRGKLIRAKSTKLTKEAGIKSVYGMLPKLSISSSHPSIGFSSLIIFDENHYIDNCNIAMLYTVGPSKKYIKDTDVFINGVYTTIQNSIKLVELYNSFKKNKEPSIDTIRLTGISAGIYKHQDISTEQVLNKILDAVKDINPELNIELPLQFTNI